MRFVAGVFVNPMRDQLGKSSLKFLILIGRQKRIIGVDCVQNQHRHVQITEDDFGYQRPG